MGETTAPQCYPSCFGIPNGIRDIIYKTTGNRSKEGCMSYIHEIRVQFPIAGFIKVSTLFKRSLSMILWSNSQWQFGHSGMILSSPLMVLTLVSNGKDDIGLIWQISTNLSYPQQIHLFHPSLLAIVFALSLTPANTNDLWPRLIIICSNVLSPGRLLYFCLQVLHLWYFLAIRFLHDLHFLVNLVGLFE